MIRLWWLDFGLASVKTQNRLRKFRGYGDETTLRVQLGRERAEKCLMQLDGVWVRMTKRGVDLQGFKVLLTQKEVEGIFALRGDNDSEPFWGQRRARLKAREEAIREFQQYGILIVDVGHQNGPRCNASHRTQPHGSIH